MKSRLLLIFTVDWTFRLIPCADAVNLSQDARYALAVLNTVILYLMLVYQYVLKYIFSIIGDSIGSLLRTCAV